MVLRQALVRAGVVDAVEDCGDGQRIGDPADGAVQELPRDAQDGALLTLLGRVRPDERVERLQPPEHHHHDAESLVAVALRQRVKVYDRDEEANGGQHQRDRLRPAVQLEPASHRCTVRT